MNRSDAVIVLVTLAIVATVVVILISASLAPDQVFRELENTCPSPLERGEICI